MAFIMMTFIVPVEGHGTFPLGHGASGSCHSSLCPPPSVPQAAGAFVTAGRVNGNLALLGSASAARLRIKMDAKSKQH